MVAPGPTPVTLQQTKLSSSLSQDLTNACGCEQHLLAHSFLGSMALPSWFPSFLWSREWGPAWGHSYSGFGRPVTSRALGPHILGKITRSLDAASLQDSWEVGGWLCHFEHIFWWVGTLRPEEMAEQHCCGVVQLAVSLACPGSEMLLFPGCYSQEGRAGMLGYRACWYVLYGEDTRTP